MTAAETFVAEIRAWPKFHEAVAQDPVHWNGKMTKLEQWFRELEANASMGPEWEALRANVHFLVGDTEKPVEERIGGLLSFMHGEYAAHQKATRQ